MSDKPKKTLGWNPTYFGEPKPGSLAAVIADVTTKQNSVVGENQKYNQVRQYKQKNNKQNLKQWILKRMIKWTHQKI